MELLEYKPTQKRGWKLLIYAIENERWPLEYKLRVSERIGASLIYDMSMYYGIKVPEVKFMSGADRGMYYSRYKKIVVRTSKKENGFRLSIIIHEFAHHLADTRANGHRQKHNKKFWQALEECYLIGDKLIEFQGAYK